MRLPLFPLHTVLFPETTLPLHVFEPRYREMIGRCLEHDETFGIALILDGDEVGGHAIPRRIGTEAAIIACQRNAHGEYDIVVQGQRRFAIRSLDRGRAYLRADVDWLDESPGKDVDILAEAVGRLFEGIVETLDMAGHASVDETWKEMDPRTLSFRVAAALPGAVDIRQELLETPDTASRLRREAELLMAVHRVEAETGAG
ncbi:MAG: peptidase S16 [Methanobacteriota archaeon]|nr:MAG: peptidase S16 [Euryarchaeota archaeon]